MDWTNCNIISWNVRGLDLKAKQDVVQETITSSFVAVACLHETKLDVFDNHLAMETLGPSFDGFFYLLASQT